MQVLTSPDLHASDLFEGTATLLSVVMLTCCPLPKLLVTDAALSAST